MVVVVAVASWLQLPSEPPPTNVGIDPHSHELQDSMPLRSALAVSR